MIILNRSTSLFTARIVGEIGLPERVINLFIEEGGLFINTKAMLYLFVGCGATFFFFMRAASASARFDGI